MELNVNNSAVIWTITSLYAHLTVDGSEQLCLIISINMLWFW